MDFDGFADRAETVEELDADLEKTSEVAGLLVDAGDEIRVASRFIQGRIFPAWDDRKLSIGPSLLYESLSLASDVSADEIEERVADIGDAGEVAEDLDFGAQRTFGSSVGSLSEVYATLEALAETEGEGSQSTKVRELANLFMDSSGLGARYLARLVLGEMRVGVGEGTVRDAVTEAFGVDADLVERGLMLTNDVGEVAEVARDEGDDGLAALEMEVGRPVKPMLAQAGEVGTVFDDVADDGEVALDWKYDGARLQIHYGDEGVRLFSRNLEDLTDSLPDVVDIVEEDAEPGTILDAEVVAVGDDSPLPFQEVLRRLRRKYRVDEMRDEVGLELHVFDVLYDDGAVIDEPLRDRYDRLDGTVDGTRAEHAAVDDVDALRRVENEALAAGHEGIMAKDPASGYSPGRRGKNWLKLKPEPETLDLVVTGGEWGEGRRASLIGSYLLSVRTGDGYETIGKVATGLTDEQLEDLTERFEGDGLILSEDGKEIEFAPEVVFEVGYEEIQTSPKYTSGYALRFPRFLGVRDDKDTEDADSLERVERIHG